ncbi:MAG: DNA primase [Chlamydiae bacterium]|nr:DNA primase [Chlamydiota bacterium]MBI3267028.1 DNA primase [Chlamydiota bacterium]
MSELIPESTLSQIQLKVDIVQLIAQYVPLKGAGRNYKALCPFHPEKTPSFMVNPEKGIFHCFGCGAGGNVFSFLMKYENIGFPEAVEILAEKAGVVISKVKEGSGEFQKKQLFDVAEKVAHFFQRSLFTEEAAEARNYLKARGVNKKMVETFRMGYCPLRETEVLKEFQRLGLEEKLLERVGVTGPGGGGKNLRFKGRIMFPIMDAQARVVGFGGRALGDQMPKYLNSPETPLFNKSQLLYGLHLAKRAILQESRVILVEGYMDMIHVYEAGVENVVASLGTAFNENHVRILRRFAQGVVVAYDGDRAGVEASLRALEVFLGQDMIVKIAQIPEGDDPDTWIRKNGKEAFLKLIQESPSMIDFKIGILMNRHPSQDEVSKLKIAREILPILSRIKNAVLQDHYLQLLSQRLKISEQSLREEIKGIKPARSEFRSGEKDPSQLPGPCALEKGLLKLILSDSRLFEKVRGEVKPEDFEFEDYKLLLQNMLENKGADSLLSDPRFQGILSSLLVEKFSFQNPEKVLSDYITTFKLRTYDKKCLNLTQELKRLEESGKNSAQIGVILVELQGLQKEIATLKKM